MPDHDHSPSLSFINPATLYDPTPNAYSQVAIVPSGTRLVFIAGQGGDSADGTLPADFQAQLRQAFANVRHALDAAAVLTDIARLTLLCRP
jgi:enamine deaminase RidA (YjgF/YER057c/UK114 family)